LTVVLEARGHAALEARATSAYEEFVAPAAFRFPATGYVERVADVGNSAVPDDEVEELIDHAYALVVETLTQGVRATL
jgi:hypothetical protein